MANELKSGLYAAEKAKVLSVADYAGFQASEVEDLFPPKFLAEVLDKIERRPDTQFAAVIKDNSPFVAQAEAWAKDQGIQLEPHWKVELAKRAKQVALQRSIDHFDSDRVSIWVNLFTKFTENAM